ncbi:MAG: Pr6Pr family membrane protein [Bifidobacterium castoris]|nr:Pr6Pr family membrane protein [Bifidobacterium castoris]
MVRSRTAQLIIQPFYVAFGLVGVLGSLGLYDAEFDPDFFVYFTNLSNYLCIGVMLCELVQTARRRDDGPVTFAPQLKFVSVIAILLTFFVFNLLLAGRPDRDPAQNFQVTSLLFHVALPLLFTFDWLLCYEHRRARWTYPLTATIFPLCYVGFVYIRAWLCHFDPDTPLLYPYFFLDAAQLGVGGVLRWIGVLLVAFVVFGALMAALDHVLPASDGSPASARAATSEAD